MTATTTHRLEGLEPDNLLAFLALLGLLRALKAAGFRSRAHWEGQPLRPVLTLVDPTTQDEIAEAAVRGSQQLSESYKFSAVGTFAFTEDELCTHIAAIVGVHSEENFQSDASLSAFVAQSVLSRKATKKGGHAFARAPLDCLGGGQSDLLATLRDAFDLLRSPATAAAAVSSALYSNWARADDRKALRWDQSDFRQHAYAAKAPTKDHARQEWGANLLGVLGSAVLRGCASGGRHRGVEFLTIASRLSSGSQVEISWPIWTVPASVAGIQALLGHPALSDDFPDAVLLKRHHIMLVYRARKIWPTQYAVFTRGEAI